MKELAPSKIKLGAAGSSPAGRAIYPQYPQQPTKPACTDDYTALLEDSLPPVGHPQREIWRAYALSAETRADALLDQISLLTPLNNAVLLDVGCGDGGLVCAARRRHCRSFGIELSTHAIRRGAARLRLRGVKPSLLQGSGSLIPIASGTVTIVTLIDVIEHVESPSQVLGECFRVLRPGGLCYLSAVNRFYFGWLLKDPHWGLAGVSLMPRRLGTWYVCHVRKVASVYDVWQLPTARSLKRWLIGCGFEYRPLTDERFETVTTAVLFAAGVKCAAR